MKITTAITTFTLAALVLAGRAAGPPSPIFSSFHLNLVRRPFVPAQSAQAPLGILRVLEQGEVPQKGIQRRSRDGGIGSLGNDGQHRAGGEVGLEQFRHVAGRKPPRTYFDDERALEPMGTAHEFARQARVKAVLIPNA